MGLHETSYDWSLPLVVVVDDEPEILRSLERALRHEPFEFVFTARPADVLRLICERHVDVVLSDQRIPEMNGTDLLEVVRDYSPDTACLILSGFPDTALVIERSGLRIERLVTKPWDNAELSAVLRGVLAERASRTAPAPRDPEAPSLPRPVSAEVRVDCAARAAEEVMAEILPLCTAARGRGERPRVVLENLPHLADSVARLLKGLARSVAWSHLPIDLRDDSGSVDAFLSALGRAPARK